MSSKKASPKKTTVPAKPTKPDRKIEMQLRHTFTIPEIVEIAKKLAEASRELNQAEEDKKAVTSQLKAKCDGIQSRLTEHAGKVNSGFEYRNTQVLVQYHTPKTGVKRLTRLDTHEVIGEEEMSQAEMQDELALESPQVARVGEIIQLGAALPNPVITEDEASKIKASPGTVGVPADEGTVDSEE
jgi:hypothetical protein